MRAGTRLRREGRGELEGYGSKEGRGSQEGRGERSFRDPNAQEQYSRGGGRWSKRKTRVCTRGVGGTSARFEKIKREKKKKGVEDIQKSTYSRKAHEFLAGEGKGKSKKKMAKRNGGKRKLNRL